jgi:hypothetical protein
MLAEPERDTLALLGHPFYDRDSEAHQEVQVMPELIKQRDDRYWIGATSETAARDFVAQSFGRVLWVTWAGPGHYRSDVYIVAVADEPEPDGQEVHGV